MPRETLTPFAEEQIVKINANRDFHDSQLTSHDPDLLYALKLERKWIRDAFELSFDIKDRIGILYVQHILGVDLGPEALESPRTVGLQGIRVHDREIGEQHAGITPMQPNEEAFWNSVCAIQPDMLTEEEKAFLIEKGGGAIELIITFDLHSSSPVIHKLGVNMHVWK